MARDRNLVTTEPYGIQSGSIFNNPAVIHDMEEATVCRIVVAHNDVIYSLTVYYTGQATADRHGGTGGTLAEVNLDPGEFITTIKGNSRADSLYITQLMFISNKERKWGPYGTESGPHPFNWNAASMVPTDLAPYMGFLYFSGTGTTEITQLQATFALYGSPTSKASISVRYEQNPVTGGENSHQIATSISKFARSLMSQVVTLLVGEEGTEFHAYENILCHLPFFSAALLTGFKETGEKKIRMPEDDPEIIAALVEFLYVRNYTYSFDPNQDTIKTHQTSPCDLKEGSFHLRLYVAASKYDCPDLTKAAMENLIYVLQQLDGINILELLKETYDRGCETATWGAGEEMEKFKRKLPEILERLYITHSEEMKNMVFECPALANDLLRLSVAKR